MTAAELLSRLTRNQVRDTFAAARRLPPERLDWKLTPSSRSAQDQLQEFATAVQFNWSLFETRRLNWSDEKAAEWEQSRSKIRDLDELEKLAYEAADRLEAMLRSLPPSELNAKIEFGDGSEYTVADCAAYHFWNGAYHEGQINYIASFIEAETSAPV